MEPILTNTIWGVEVGKFNRNNTLLSQQTNRLIDLTSFTVSDVDDLYAHESQILIHRLANKTVLLVMYTSDKVTGAERALTAHALLKVYELTTKTLLKTLDMFAPGMEAGVTMEADESITAPRMYITGNTLMCFCGNESTLYHRTIDMTNNDPSVWTASNISIFQMTMKDSGGSNVKVNVTSVNVQSHLEYTLGDTYAGYQGLAPWFRNLDRIAIHGTDWYSILELSDEMGAGLSNIAVLIKSTDNGINWSFLSLIAYTTSNRIKVIEASVVFIGTSLHIIHRQGGNTTLGRIHSDDYGSSWIINNNITGVMGSKPVAINYTKPDGSTIDVLVAFNLTSEIEGAPHRTTLGIFTTSNFIAFNEIGKIVSTNFAHYPSLCYFDRALYISYTKGLKYFTENNNAYANDRDTIVIARVY